MSDGRPALLQNAAFRRLFAAQLISLLGSGVTTVGLALFAYRLTGGVSATAVIGDALMLRILAFLVFSQPAGVLADRVDRRKMLVAADIARAALLASFPFVTTVWQIGVLVFAINAVTAFFTPTFEASIPEVVGTEHYVQALGLSRIAVDVEAIAAPAVAALLVAIVGVRWVFWFDAATYLVSAVLVVSVTIPHARKDRPALSWRAFASEITHGTRVLLREPSLRQALALSLVEATAGAAGIVVTVAYVHDVLRGGDTMVSFAMAAIGLGSTAVAFTLARATARIEAGAVTPAELHGRRHRWAARALVAGGALLAIVLGAASREPPLVVFVIAWIGNGAGQALIAMSSSTLLAEHTRAEERGRAYAAHFALTHACWLVTYPAVGHAAAGWSAPMTFAIGGAICAVITLVAAVAGRAAPRPHTH